MVILNKLEVAVFAAGCFWGVQHAFAQMPGVVNTKAGYCGGITKNPSYQEVCTGTTGHAESVWVEFNPAKVSFTQLLDLFFSIHDPTSINRQGADSGLQYQSAIFYSSPQQKKLAREKIALLEKSKKFGGKKIATKLVALEKFWDAEGYHQNYLERTQRNSAAFKSRCRIPFGSP